MHTRGVSKGDMVTCGVTKGLVNGATVMFHSVDQFGFPLATDIASARTNDVGNFTMTVSAYLCCWRTHRVLSEFE